MKFKILRDMGVEQENSGQDTSKTVFKEGKEEEAENGDLK